MPDPKEKIEDLIRALEELRLHVARKDLAVGNQRINSQLYFSIANACLRNRALLLYGGMGANKTTLVNLLGSSFLSLSFGEVEDQMVTGYPEQTEEKMVGFLDPRQWTPEFSATYPLDEALLDRISVCVPAFQPNFLAGLALSERERGVGELAEELPRFTLQEFDSLPGLVAQKELEPQVELAVLCLVRDFTLCERAPSYDKTQLSSARPSRGLCAGCHYSGNPEAICWQADEGLSDRVRQDLRSFSRALAYLLDREADLEVLKAVAPYVIWHRINPIRSIIDRPPYYGARKLAFVAELVEKSINRTMNERADMNIIFSRAVDGETSVWRAMEELSIFDDPIARLDFIPSLEQMR